jgi:hypothetical protein
MSRFPRCATFRCAGAMTGMMMDVNEFTRRAASGVNLRFGASQPVVGARLISAALLVSYGGDERRGGSAQPDLEPLQP